MDTVLDRGIGLVFWFSGYKVVEILSTNYSRKARLWIFIAMLVVALFIIYKIECRRRAERLEREKQKDAILEKYLGALKHAYMDHEDYRNTDFDF